MAKKRNKDSEFRLYGFIIQSLKELQWNTKNPSRYADGEVYTQNESLQNPILKETLGKDRPENIIVVDENIFWVVEAKTSYDDIESAVSEAKEYARKINTHKTAKCKFVTGVAGDIDSTFIVETWFHTNKGWKKVCMNGLEITGFITKEQVRKILFSNDSDLLNEEIADHLFLDKANHINEILQNGAIIKKNRARVIASLLLALVEDPYFRINDDPTTLIEDINSRVRALLRKHKKENFAQEIAIALPTSRDNHKKNKRAITQTIQELRSLNIRSAINSGKDVLGQFYEVFLKYANDAKEIGIVLTPRHITKFAAEVTGVGVQDYIYDPTCGTGGFLVSALDKVKQSLPKGKSFESFKESHIYGIEQEPEVVGLALVNMIFRKDGKSNIHEGNCFDNFFFKQSGQIKRVKREKYLEGIKKGVEYERFITRTLMNPPFALKEEEFQFVNHAMNQMVEGGLLFAVLPTSVMTSGNDGGGELTWRKNLLQNHTLKAVIKLSEDLFQPNAHKGTYAVVIQTWIPHANKKVFWSVMDDGFTMVKAKRLPSKTQPSNMDLIQNQLKGFILADNMPQTIERIMGCAYIDLDNPTLDLSPEHHLPMDSSKQVDFSLPVKSLYSHILNSKKNKIADIQGKVENFKISSIIQTIARGDCAPLNSLSKGSIPIVTTTENNNGICGYLSPIGATIFKDRVTIPANGSKYIAYYHPYKFAANADVLICEFKAEYDTLEMKLYFCSMYNKNSWRFSWFRKCTEDKISDDLLIPFPVKSKGVIDMVKVKKYLTDIPEFTELLDLIK
jgi:type I restriction-modification system DNA methylase subunit